MKRTLTAVGATVIALVGAVAASQAQGPQNPAGAGAQRGDRPEFGCGPGRGPAGNTDGQRPPQGAVRERGQAGGRQAGVGRPGGPGKPGRRGGRGDAMCGLDLTADQKTQIETIRQKSRVEVEAVLTPEQLEKLRARRGGK